MVSTRLLIRMAKLQCLDLFWSGRQAGLEPECEAKIKLHGNTDPGFTPGSTPSFGPGSGSISIVNGRNKNH